MIVWVHEILYYCITSGAYRVILSSRNVHMRTILLLCWIFLFPTNFVMFSCWVPFAVSKIIKIPLLLAKYVHCHIVGYHICACVCLRCSNRYYCGWGCVWIGFFKVMKWFLIHWIATILGLDGAWSCQVWNSEVAFCIWEWVLRICWGTSWLAFSSDCCCLCSECIMMWQVMLNEHRSFYKLFLSSKR